GLDEMPEERRLACVSAITAYAGNVIPRLPFALTSRVKEYMGLGDGLVTADQCVGLVGLEPDQILAVVEERTAHLPQWAAIRGRLSAGDQGLLRLFRSPLRLTAALQGYEHDCPDEL